MMSLERSQAEHDAQEHPDCFTPETDDYEVAEYFEVEVEQVDDLMRERWWDERRWRPRNPAPNRKPLVAACTLNHPEETKCPS
jgi:hypothetical protein